MILGQGAALGIYAVATGIGLGFGGYLWQYRENPGVVPLAVSLVATAFFSGPLFVATAVDSFAVSSFMNRLLYVGVGGSVLCITLFALEYTGREHLVTRRTVALLSIEPVVAVVLAFTNPGNVFFSAFAPDPTAPTGVSVEFGIGFGLHTIYSYLLMAVVTGLMVEFLYTSRGLYRGQALALIGAVTFPWFANIIHVVGPIDVDITPVGFIVTGVLYTVAIVRYRLSDVVPIARDRIIETVSEGIFVVDREDRIVDTNPAAREILGIDHDTSLSGRAVGSVFVDSPDILELYRELTASQTETTVEFSRGESAYEVTAVPIDDNNDRHAGWLVLVCDVTERKRREEQLEDQNDRLEGFASLVSHDLRNPLNVADGYLELAQETDDDEGYLAEIEESYDRMETIIEDVLTLARQGEDVADPEPVALDGLAESAWAGVDTGATTVGIETDASIRADPDRTRRLFENLFRNALEHAADGDGSDLEITVGSIEDEDGSFAGFYVADDGVGIPSDRREQVLENGYTTDEEGTGLGLAIVASIADAHDWTLRVAESEAGGARFEFRGIEPAADTTGVSPANEPRPSNADDAATSKNREFPRRPDRESPG